MRRSKRFTSVSSHTGQNGGDTSYGRDGDSDGASDRHCGRGVRGGTGLPSSGESTSC